VECSGGNPNNNTTTMHGSNNAVNSALPKQADMQQDAVPTAINNECDAIVAAHQSSTQQQPSSNIS
jgi:hypothetical protein